MPTIHPFCGLRYDPERVSDLSDVIAPPYDVIDAAAQERLYQASAYNIVRLILGKSSPTDTPEQTWHTRAARDFTAWRSEGILRPDPLPAIYLIEQTFGEASRPRCRLGVIALMDLRDDVSGMVYRHEATLDAPKQDRTRLLEAIPANLSPIFCVYPDQGAATQRLLQEAARVAPTVTASMNGEAIRVWMITDSRTIHAVSGAIGAGAALIADGHHRFEVAYAKRDRYPALMTYFVSMEDQALVVQPIHRLVRQPVPMEALRRWCAVEPVGDLSSLTQWLHVAPGQGCFGVWDGRQLYRVSLHAEPLARWLMAPSVPRAIATLDVSLLHQLLLPQLYPSTRPTASGRGLAQDSAPRASEETSSASPVGLHDHAAPALHYTADASAALRMVQEGAKESAWFLRGIPLPQVYALAAQGLTLPPKSTYFYPKVPSGLVLNLLRSS